uniref:non-specific serine/threonine protein kinase n=1 Tax=Setaria viridis TaxID=4556 RepID=A0A4U6T792_SETVI|nr:hypothetical protein SEVIR_9G186200v2 [Setaria viridis]
MLRSRGAAAEVDADAPLELPVLKEETWCSNTVQQTTFHIEELPWKFSYDEIRASRVLDDGTAVAFKRITSDKPVGEADFLREVSIVASVHHRSLVRLLGYYLLRGSGSQYLVYPFFEHGLLDWWLFNGEERRRLLPWPAQRHIAIDVARALAYLHHDLPPADPPLDVKPANIFLPFHDLDASQARHRRLISTDTRKKGTFFSKSSRTTSSTAGSLRKS